MDIEPTIEQEWKRVIRPSKTVAKIFFSTGEELSNQREGFFKTASGVCNILFCQSFPKADPPYINLHVENKDSLRKLKEKFNDKVIEEVERTNIDLSKQLIVISNSPRTTVEDVRTRLKEYGPLIYVSHFAVPNSSKKFFAVAYEDEEICERLARQSNLFIGQDLIHIEKNESPKTRNPEKKFIMKLSNLPLATTDWQLNDIMTELKAKHWRIPFSRNQKRMPICYVAFNSEDDLFCAKKTRLKYKGYELLWSAPSENVCERCLASDHSFRNCRSYIPKAQAQPRRYGYASEKSREVASGLSYSSIVRQNDEDHEIRQIRTKHQLLKEANDLLEEEIKRSKLLRTMQAELTGNEMVMEDSRLMEDDLSCDGQACRRQIRNTGDLIRSIESKVEEFIAAAEQNTKEIVGQRVKEFEERLTGIENSLANLCKMLSPRPSNQSEPSVKRGGITKAKRL